MAGTERRPYNTDIGRYEAGKPSVKAGDCEMYENFAAVYPRIRHEFEEAEFDPASGLSPEALKERIARWMEANEDLPVPLLFSGARRILIENCRIAVNPLTPFAGKICHGVHYQPDHAGSGLLEQLFDGFYRRRLEETAPEAWKKRSDGSECAASTPDVDVWHICPDWERLMRLGIPGLRGEVRQSMERMREEGRLTPDRKAFFDAMTEDCDSILLLMERLRTASLQSAPDYASALGKLQAGPPQTLYEVLVLSRIYLYVLETGKERGRTYGAVDLLWYPYYQADRQSGRLTEEEAIGLLRFFFAQTAAECRFADQPICLGSVYPDGREGPTDFTLLILRAYDPLEIHNPKVHLRCSENMNPKLMRTVLDMIRRGHSSIVMINDETVYRAYEKIGIPREMSVRYLPIGCYEPVIPGVEDARICSAWINMSKAAEWALTGGHNILQDTPEISIGTPENPPDYETYLRAFYDHLRHLVNWTCNVLDSLYVHPEKAYASPVASVTVESCVKKGLDLFEDGMDIRNLSLKCFGLGTAVDSVMAVKEFVYEKKLISVPELIEALRADWKGYEKLRLQVLASRRKWGNHQPEADAVAKAMYDLIWSEIKDRPTANGGRYRIGCDSVMQSSWGHRMGATPDGRRERAILSRNMRPNNGMEREGVLAFMQSVAQLDASRFADAAPLDFWLHPTAVAGEEGMRAFEGMIRAFFAMGGFCLHGNVLNTATLLDARKHPENHRELQIRVCGWNEYFVNLSEELQDDFIARSRGLESAG